MVKPIIISESPVSMADMKDKLENIKKKEKELNFRSNKTYDYLSQFTILDKKKADELASKLEKLAIPRLKDIHIVKIVDLMPNSVDDLKAILLSYTITVNNENLKKIIDVVDKYR
jgi:DNA-directed RNA polymerase subunit F